MIRRPLVITAEELVNVATHGVGLVVSIVMLPVFVYLAMRGGDAGVILGVAVFALTLVGAYFASTMYHALPPCRRRDYWRRMDQSAVYLLIAGTYTPFALGVLRGPWGWTLLSIIWATALMGILVKVRLRIEAPTLETITYLAMGWLVIVAVPPLVERIGWAGVAWLGAGGIAYTVGVVFLVCQKRLRYGHCAWHFAVLGGSACHAIAVVNYGLTLPR